MLSRSLHFLRHQISEMLHLQSLTIAQDSKLLVRDGLMTVEWPTLTIPPGE
jgi:hypothetical protein